MEKQKRKGTPEWKRKETEQSAICFYGSLDDELCLKCPQENVRLKRERKILLCERMEEGTIAFESYFIKDTGSIFT